ncbi:MAG: hypothetical protein ACRDN9_00710 [Streptosporangiaceae bacterium]
MSISTPDRHAIHAYVDVVERLTSEFDGTHPAGTVSRCVAAARHGAEDVTGAASPDLVERIARQHLEVLALAQTPTPRDSNYPE